MDPSANHGVADKTVPAQFLYLWKPPKGHRQMVKAQDFDSCISGSNPDGPVDGSATLNDSR